MAGRDLGENNFRKLDKPFEGGVAILTLVHTHTTAQVTTGERMTKKKCK